MCGRYSISKPASEIAEHFGVVSESRFDTPRYNAAPTLDLPAIGMDDPKFLRLFQWGMMPPWQPAGGGAQRIINARIESVFQKKTFSSLIKSSRCLIPATGFFEWEKSGKRKQPWRFVLEGEDLFAFAGIYQMQTLPHGQSARFFCILTTQANTLIKTFHERMPVILDLSQAKKWLRREELPDPEEFSIPFPSEKMRSYKVTPLVNDTRRDTPDLILPWNDNVLKLF